MDITLLLLITLPACVVGALAYFAMLKLDEIGGSHIEEDADG